MNLQVMLKNRESVYFSLGSKKKVKSIYFLHFILKNNSSKRGKAGYLNKLGILNMAQEKDVEDLSLGTDLAKRELGNGQVEPQESLL